MREAAVSVPIIYIKMSRPEAAAFHLKCKQWLRAVGPKCPLAVGEECF